MTSDEKLYTIPEAATLLGVSQLTVRNRIKTGKLRALYREGERKYLIPESELHTEPGEIREVDPENPPWR